MFKELRDKIEAVDSIVSCKITGEDEIDEIHVIADKEREPKRIVRDIETIVMVNADREIDHKKISIAQLNKSVEHSGSSRRVKIISIYQEHDSDICHIKLNIDGDKIEKKINGTGQEPLSLLISRGIISIIEDYINFQGKLRVESVFTTGINNEILIVQLNLFFNGFSAQERLLGAVYIDQNLPLAAGKACLKALNRRIFRK